MSGQTFCSDYGRTLMERLEHERQEQIRLASEADRAVAEAARDFSMSVSLETLLDGHALQEKLELAARSWLGAEMATLRRRAEKAEAALAVVRGEAS